MYTLLLSLLWTDFEAFLFTQHVSVLLSHIHLKNSQRILKKKPTLTKRIKLQRSKTNRRNGAVHSLTNP